MTSADESGGDELRARIRVLEQENDALSESVQITQLLRKIAEVASEAEGEPELLDGLLEHAAVLLSLPWCACYVPSEGAPRCLASYSAATDEGLLSRRVRIADEAFEQPRDHLAAWSLEEAAAAGLRLNFPPSVEVSRLFAYPYGTVTTPSGLLLFAAGPSDEAHLGGLRPLLGDVGRLIVLRLERFAYNLELRRVNADLERRVVERTAALRESESNQRAIFEQAAVGIVNLTDRGVILHCNRGFLDMLGYDELSELVGVNFQAISHPDHRLEGKENVQALWAGKVDHIVQDKRYLKKNGETAWGRAVVSLLRDQAGVPMHSIAVVTDITGQKETEAALRQVQKMQSIGELAGGIAHDFNNLLTPILCIAELLLADERTEPFHDDLETVRFTAERAGELTKKILAFSRKQVFQLSRVHLSRVVGELESMLRRTIREDVVLEVTTRGAREPILGDAVQLEQVLMNLTVNAQDAMPDGGTLRIAVSDVSLDAGVAELPKGAPAGAYVRLSVSDTGEGMPLEVIDRIYEPFFTTKSKGHGTGLGLSTVHGIVHQHQGHLRVSSEVGVGTRFTALFPVYRGPARRQSSVSLRSSRARGSESVVVVDDDEQVRRLACRILRRQGYKVSGYSSGAGLLRELGEDFDHIDLLLTDVVMPQMSGHDLWSRVEARQPGVRVLFMSGYPAYPRGGATALPPGARFLPKPLSIASLLAAVREALDA